MLKESSAGAVVFRVENGKRLYLLLLYTGGYLDFPKGNIEKGETEEQTVTREVQEETGIADIKFILGFKERVRYFYRREGGTVNKDVVYFLAETGTKDVKISYEHAGFEWLEFQGALNRISFNNSKTVLKKAEEFLAGEKGLGKFLK